MFRETSNLSLTHFKRARERIKGLINRTPCVYSLPLSRRTGKRVFLKLENLQITQAFKARGNANKVARLTEGEKKKGVITASSGNHGQGLSLAALRSGIRATIVLPKVAPTNKVEKVKGNKSKVIIHGETYDDAAAYAHSLAQEEGYIYIPSFDDPDIIAGNASMGMEILEDIPDVELILCPIGGGGGISGVSVAVKQINSSVKIIGVEAEQAPSMLESIKANKIVELPSADTIADGIAVRRPGRINFEIVKRYVDDIVTVSEDEMKATIVTLAREAKIIAEAAGAATTAALLFEKLTIECSNVVCIVTGGNIDLSLFKTILSNIS
jgi:threonine dehydratase